MKSIPRLLNFLFLFVAVALIGSTAYAQERGARLSTEGQLLLPVESPLKADYTFDISALGFSSEVEAVNYFKNQGDKAHFYRAVPGQSRAIVYLDLKANPDWSVTDWNNFLEEKKLKSTGEPFLDKR